MWAQFLDRPRRVIEHGTRNRVDFALRRGARIVGRVVDAETGKPITRFRAGLIGPYERFLPARHWEFGLGPFGDGRFEIVDVIPGKPHWVFVDAPGYAGGVSAELTLAENERRDGVEVRIARGAFVRGLLRAPDGKPVANARVALRFQMDLPDDRARSLRARLRSNAPRVRTDAEGMFVIRDLPDGQYEIGVTHPDFAPRVSAPFVVPRGTGVELDAMVLEWGGRIRGTVRLPDGRPDSRGAVWAQPAESGWGSDFRWERTNDDGRYEITGLTAGSYRVSIIMRENRGIFSPAREHRFDWRSKQNEPKVAVVRAGEVTEVDF